MFYFMRDKTLKKSKAKTVVLSLVIAASLSLPLGSYAQDGLFQRGVSDEVYYGAGGNYGLMQSKSRDVVSGVFAKQTFGANYEGTFINQTFGQNAPLGSGLFILLTAGMGYVARSRRKEKLSQTKTERRTRK